MFYENIILVTATAVHADFDKDIKYSIGAGIRMLVEGAVIRVEVAVSEENIGIQMFVSHTFWRLDNRFRINCQYLRLRIFLSWSGPSFSLCLDNNALIRYYLY